MAGACGRADAAGGEQDPLAALDRLLAVGDAAAAQRQALGLLADPKLEPRHRWQVQQRLGVALLALDRPEDAVAALESSLETAPHEAATHVNLGRAWSRLGRLGRAVGSFETALTLAPSQHLWRLEFAEVLSRLGIRRDALRQVQMARADCGDCREALRAEANLHLAAGDPRAAADVLRLLHELQPEAAVRRLLAGSLWDLGEAEAVATLLGDVPPGHLTRAELLLLIQADRALGEHRRALAWVADGPPSLAEGEQPDHTFWAILAEVCQGGGEPAAALTAIDRALEAAPQVAVYHHNRAAILLDLGRDEDARRALAEARRLDPSLAGGQP